MYRSTSENRRSAPCTCVDLGTDLDSRSIDILFYDLFSSASSLHGGGGGGGGVFLILFLKSWQLSNVEFRVEDFSIFMFFHMCKAIFSTEIQKGHTYTP